VILQMKTPRYELLDHTADLGFSVRAGTVEGLFEEAGLALCDLLTDPETVRQEAERRIEIEGVDREDLIVGWLAELLSLHDAEGWLFSGIRIESLTQTRLVAAAIGERRDPARHLAKGEIKAVTHHGAAILCGEEGWTARVILDI
jgi:SHS2 domain-containing protein